MRCTFLTLAALLACRDKAPEPTPPASPPPPRDGVTLLQPGTPPLQVLRYHLTRGSKTSSELECDVDVKNDQEGGPLPTLIVELETTVEDVLADGSAKLRIAVIGTSVREREGSEMPSQVASNVMRAQAAALRGVVLTQTLAPDGAVSDSHVLAPGVPGGSGAIEPAGAQLDSLLRSLERVAMRLPAEPVGAGATWRERRTLPEGGIRAVAEITYTLASLTGTSMAYTSTGQLAGSPQTVEQDGAKVEVQGTHGRSDVRGSVDLSRYEIDVTAASAFASTMTVVASDAGPGAERSTVEIAMTIRLS
ncbi:MAG TPA: hypothetical protein VF469_35920, partial [Kofleriaceae bacterium]